MIKEFEFLKIIDKTLDDSSYLGDDCAYLREYDLVISTDSLIEDVHFKLDFMTPYEIAKKALLVNISDILASGAKPSYATIALSGQLNEDFIKEFYKGINDTALEYDIKIIGGDLTKSEKITIAITILGSARRRNISSRKNALENYVVAVAGEFGSSALGLYQLGEGLKESYFIDAHKNPYIQYEVSERIGKIAQLPYAMMDSSDGLIDCLYQISKKSNIRIDVEYEKIPRTFENKDFVLHGGEDYSLVICLDESDFNSIDGLTKIGTCSKGKGVYVDNKKMRYKAYEHFKKG